MMSVPRIRHFLTVSHAARRRYSTAWLNAPGDKITKAKLPKNDAEVQEIFLTEPVQSALAQVALTCDPRTVLTPLTAASSIGDASFELMNDTLWKKTLDAVSIRAQSYMQCPPVMEPMGEPVTLSKDDEIAGHDASRFVFCDISGGVDDHERTVVVREPDGVLRTATPEELSRIVRIYYERPYVYPELPKMFYDPYKTRLFINGHYRYFLDSLCNWFEPNNPQYIKLCTEAYLSINRYWRFNTIDSTRHFAHMLFYLCINGMFYRPLSNMLIQQRIDRAIALTCLFDAIIGEPVPGVPKMPNDQNKFLHQFVNRRVYGDAKSELRKVIDDAFGKVVIRNR